MNKGSWKRTWSWNSWTHCSAWGWNWRVAHEINEGAKAVVGWVAAKNGNDPSRRNATSRGIMLTIVIFLRILRSMAAESI